MSDPTAFVDACRALGADLSEPIDHAVRRYRAIVHAIAQVAEHPLTTLDVTTIEPDQAAEAVTAIIDAEHRRSLVHSPAVIGLRERAAGAAVRTIGEHAAQIIATLRPVHDAIAEKLTEAAGRLRGIDSTAALVSADSTTRALWAERPELHQRMRQVRALREDLRTWGYGLNVLDLSGRQFEELTRYVDVPATATWAQVVTWYGYADEHQWDAVLDEGARLWLPTTDEQRQAIDRLRQLKAQRVSA